MHIMKIKAEGRQTQFKWVIISLSVHLELGSKLQMGTDPFIMSIKCIPIGYLLGIHKTLLSCPQISGTIRADQPKCGLHPRQTF